MSFVRYIPNTLSTIRIIASLSLFFIEIMSPLFQALYIFSFVTDCVDGTIARKLNATSELGKNLDTVGDMALIGVTIFWIVPWMNLPLWLILWLAGIFVARISCMLYMRYRAGIFVFPHSIPNKITTFMAFLIPFWQLWFGDLGLIFPFAFGTFDAIHEWYHSGEFIRKKLAIMDGLGKEQSGSEAQ